MALRTGRKFGRYPGATVVEVTRTKRSPFAPSQALLDDYKAGRATWEDYERRYTDEMRAGYRANPAPWHALIDRAAVETVVLTCYEGGDEATVKCHRRLLAGLLRAVAAARGVALD